MQAPCLRSGLLPLLSRTIGPACVLPSRGKVNIANKYREPSYDRKLLLAACEPVIPRDRRPSWDRCKLPEFEAKKQEGQQRVHPYEVILSKELRQEMQDSHLIAVYHMNSMTDEAYKKVKNALQHQDLWMKGLNRRVYRDAIRDTKFSSLEPLLCSVGYTVLVIAKGDANVQTLLTADKKMPGFIFMFAFLHDRLLYKEQLLAVNERGSLQNVRAQLAGTLNHALASLSAHITHPTSLLSLTLDHYVQREQQQQQKQQQLVNSSSSGSSDGDGQQQPPQ